MELKVDYNVPKNIHYIYRKDGGDWGVRSVLFDAPIPLSEAVSHIGSDKTVVDMLCFYKYFAQKTLMQIKKDLDVNQNFKDVKVKGMIDFGQTAFVFETETGDILKITNRDHFLGRESKEFDLPIKTKGKLAPKSFCYYYVEEKTTGSVSEQEMNTAIERIKSLGYEMADCRCDQFGKTKSGEILLLDPECARKSGIFGFLKQKFMKLKSFVSMAK